MTGSADRIASDDLLVAALVDGATQDAAAQRAGCSPRTVRRRLADPRFLALLDDARRTSIAMTTTTLEAGAREAAAHLRVLVRHDDPRVSLAACRVLLDQAGRWREAEDFARRLDAIEAVLFVPTDVARVA